MPEFLERAAEKSGFSREKFEESSPKKVTVLPFFGDFRSTFILSTFLLKNYIKDYFILCSWKGLSPLFPYVDEYWSLDNPQLYESSFINKSTLLLPYFRNLNKFFDDVLDENDNIFAYYDNGLKLNRILRFFPDIPSSMSLGKNFTKDLNSKAGYKIFVFPSVYIQSYFRKNKLETNKISKDFWLTLLKFLLKNGYTPVVYKSFLTYDLSYEFPEGIHVDGNILSVMRATGLVLDIFSGISRLAISARTPFIFVDERARYNDYKEYEIDDLCAKDIAKQYIFSFSKIILENNNLENLIFDLILTKLNYLCPYLDKDSYPSTAESEVEVSYNSVREKKLKKLGIKWLKWVKQEQE